MVSAGPTQMLRGACLQSTCVVFHGHKEELHKTVGQACSIIEQFAARACITYTTDSEGCMLEAWSAKGRPVECPGECMQMDALACLGPAAN